MKAVPRAQGPLRSTFPGELALRDLPERTTSRLGQVVTARLLVLQLAERYALLESEERPSALEIEAAHAYVSPIATLGPIDELHLRRILTRMASNQPRRVIAALIACGDSCLNQEHRLAAWGFYLAGFELAGRINQDAAALSLASRLAELAAVVQRGKAAEQWRRRQTRLVQRCH